MFLNLFYILIFHPMTTKTVFRPVFIFYLFAALLFACGQNTGDKKTSAVENPPPAADQIVIDTFSTFPPEIDGCACYFSNDETEFKKQVYIYVDNFEKTAWITLNGTLTEFELDKTETVSEKRAVSTYKNDRFELIIDLKQTGQVEETWQFMGTMTVKSASGKELAKNLVGECGC